MTLAYPPSPRTALAHPQASASASILYVFSAWLLEPETLRQIMGSAREFLASSIDYSGIKTQVTKSNSTGINISLGHACLTRQIKHVHLVKSRLRDVGNNERSVAALGRNPPHTRNLSICPKRKPYPPGLMGWRRYVSFNRYLL
jgi:hypothetical protein